MIKYEWISMINLVLVSIKHNNSELVSHIFRWKIFKLFKIHFKFQQEIFRSEMKLSSHWVDWWWQFVIWNTKIIQGEVLFGWDHWLICAANWTKLACNTNVFIAWISWFANAFLCRKNRSGNNSWWNFGTLTNLIILRLGSLLSLHFWFLIGFLLHNLILFSSREFAFTFFTKLLWI